MSTPPPPPEGGPYGPGPDGPPPGALPQWGAHPQPGHPRGGAPVQDPLVATSFSDWWSKVIGVLARSWRTLLLIQLATVVPGLVVSTVVTATADSRSTVVSTGGLVLGLVGGLIVFVVALLAQGASVYVVGKQASGEEIGAGPALGFAVGRALPLLGWGIVAGLLLFVGFLLLVVPGLYLLVVFGATLTGVIMFEKAGIGRTFQLVNPAFGQTLGRLLSFGIAAFVYAAIAGAVARAIAGPDGFASDILANLLTLPVTFASVGVAVVTYAGLRNRENPAVTTPVLAAELDRP